MNAPNKGLMALATMPNRACKQCMRAAEHRSN